MRDLRIYVQQRWAEQEGRSPNQIARSAPFAAAAGPITGMSESTCFWCGNEGHIKTRCPDYQNSLANRMIHLQGIRERSCWRYAPGSWRGDQRTSRRRRRRSGRVERRIASISTKIDATDLRITKYAAETWFCCTIRNSIRRTHTSYRTGGLGRIGLPTLQRKEIGEPID